MQLYDKYRRIFRGHPIRNHLKVYGDDTFLVSYPRSGNTWIRFLLGTAMSTKKIDWHNFETVIPDIYRNTHQELEALERPRIIKSHHSFDKRYPKVIYVIRDVRDVYISYYKFHLKFKSKNVEISRDEFLDRFINGGLDDFGTWRQNVLSWTSKQEELPNGLLLLKYEELKTNPSNTLRDLAQFIGIELSEDSIEKAVGWTSLENMKLLEKQQTDASLFKNSKKGMDFTNNGLPKGWRNMLSDNEIEIITESNRDVLERFGYEIS